MKNKKKLTVFILSFIFVVLIFISSNTISTLYPIYKSYNKTRIEDNVKNYKTLESEHFIVKYEGNNDDIAKLVILIGEKHYIGVVNDLGFEPINKSLIIVYNNPDKMNRDFSLAKGESAMGLYFNGVISIENPYLWIGSKDNIEEVFEKEGPIVHEFTHLIVDDIAKGNYPVWFTEGVALLEEYRQNGFEWGKDLSYKGLPYNLEQLTNNFNSLDESLAYKRSYEILKAITDRYGIEAVKNILFDLGKGDNLSDSFYKITGEKLNVFVNSVK
ncbi:MAG: peptidase MA family metallohydrolase [Minisyncoccia bacterium]